MSGVKQYLGRKFMKHPALVVGLFGSSIIFGSLSLAYASGLYLGGIDGRVVKKDEFLETRTGLQNGFVIETSRGQYKVIPRGSSTTMGSESCYTITEFMSRIDDGDRVKLNASGSVWNNEIYESTCGIFLLEKANKRQ